MAHEVGTVMKKFVPDGIACDVSRLGGASAEGEKEER
jgi:hypothetical protein